MLTIQRNTQSWGNGEPRECSYVIKLFFIPVFYIKVYRD